MNLGWIPSMGLYVAGLLILGLTFRHHLKKGNQSQKKDWMSVLEQEHATQFVRNKALDEKYFIHIDFSVFPHVEEAECKAQYLTLMHYTKSPMVNMNGESNLSLKSIYGPQVVETVANYERNYNDFMNNAIGYAEILLAHGFDAEAQLTLETCLKYGCDLSKCYLLLGTLYSKQKNNTALTKLGETAKINMMHSPFLPKVLAALETSN